MPHGHPAAAPCSLVSSGLGADQGIGRVVPHSSVTGQFEDAVMEAKVFGLDAVVGNVSDGRGTLIFGRGNIILHDP